jgi:HCOMODA/2-hydroxy-3-carboxy-muconic semialdehyde decarboxylase
VRDDKQEAVSRSEIVDAARVLAALDLVTAFGHVSARVGDRMVITPAAALAGVKADELVAVALDATTLPAGAPAESWIHLNIYRVRPDVSAIARAQPPEAFAAAAAAGAGLPPLHGQAAWVGRFIPVYDDARLLRSSELAGSAAASLGDSDGLLLRGNGAVTTAAEPGLAVARMWLLAAACRTWLAATSAGAVHPLTEIEIDSWRAVQGELLPRLWRHLRNEWGEARD